MTRPQPPQGRMASDDHGSARDHTSAELAGAAAAPRTRKDGTINRSENAARQWHGSYVSRANGRSGYRAACPFCAWPQFIYTWSLNGGGKRCERPDCRAMFSRWGTCHPVEGQEGRAPVGLSDAAPAGAHTLANSGRSNESSPLLPRGEQQ